MDETQVPPFYIVWNSGGDWMVEMDKSFPTEEAAQAEIDRIEAETIAKYGREQGVYSNTCCCHSYVDCWTAMFSNEYEAN